MESPLVADIIFCVFKQLLHEGEWASWSKVRKYRAESSVQEALSWVLIATDMFDLQVDLCKMKKKWMDGWMEFLVIWRALVNDLIGFTQFLISESNIYTNEVGVVSSYSVVLFVF